MLPQASIEHDLFSPSGSLLCFSSIFPISALFPSMFFMFLRQKLMLRINDMDLNLDFDEFLEGDEAEEKRRREEQRRQRKKEREERERIKKEKARQELEKRKTTFEEALREETKRLLTGSATECEEWCKSVDNIRKLFNGIENELAYAEDFYPVTAAQEQGKYSQSECLDRLKGIIVNRYRKAFVRQRQDPIQVKKSKVEEREACLRLWQPLMRALLATGRFKMSAFSDPIKIPNLLAEASQTYLDMELELQRVDNKTFNMFGFINRASRVEGRNDDVQIAASSGSASSAMGIDGVQELMAQKLEGLGIDEEETGRGRMKKAGRCSPELGRQAQTEQKEVAGDDADSTPSMPPSALLKKRYVLLPLSVHTFIVSFRISSKRRSPSPIDHTAISEKMSKSATAADELEIGWCDRIVNGIEHNQPILFVAEEQRRQPPDMQLARLDPHQLLMNLFPGRDIDRLRGNVEDMDICSESNNCPSAPNSLNPSPSKVVPSFHLPSQQRFISTIKFSFSPFAPSINNNGDRAQDAEQRVAEAEKTSNGQSEAVPENGNFVEKKPSTAGAEMNKEGQAELQPQPQSLDPTQLPPFPRVSEFPPLLLPHFIYQQVPPSPTAMYTSLPSPGLVVNPTLSQQLPSFLSANCFPPSPSPSAPELCINPALYQQAFPFPPIFTPPILPGLVVNPTLYQQPPKFPTSASVQSQSATTSSASHNQEVDVVILSSDEEDEEQPKQHKRNTPPVETIRHEAKVQLETIKPEEDISLQRAHRSDSSRPATTDSPFNNIAAFYEGIHVQELMSEMSYDVEMEGVEEEKEEGEYSDEADQVKTKEDALSDAMSVETKETGAGREGNGETIANEEYETPNGNEDDRDAEAEGKEDLTEETANMGIEVEQMAEESKSSDEEMKRVTEQMSGLLPQAIETGPFADPHFRPLIHPTKKMLPMHGSGDLSSSNWEWTPDCEHLYELENGLNLEDLPNEDSFWNLMASKANSKAPIKNLLKEPRSDTEKEKEKNVKTVRFHEFESDANTVRIYAYNRPMISESEPRALCKGDFQPQPVLSMHDNGAYTAFDTTLSEVGNWLHSDKNGLFSLGPYIRPAPSAHCMEENAKQHLLDRNYNQTKRAIDLAKLEKYTVQMRNMLAQTNGRDILEFSISPLIHGKFSPQIENERNLEEDAYAVETLAELAKTLCFEVPHCIPGLEPTDQNNPQPLANVPVKGILIISDQGLSLLNATSLKNAALFRIGDPLEPDDIIDMFKSVMVAEQLELRYVYLCWGHDDLLGLSEEAQKEEDWDWDKAQHKAFRFFTALCQICDIKSHLFVQKGNVGVPKKRWIPKMRFLTLPEGGTKKEDIERFNSRMGRCVEKLKEFFPNCGITDWAKTCRELDILGPDDAAPNIIDRLRALIRILEDEADLETFELRATLFNEGGSSRGLADDAHYAQMGINNLFDNFIETLKQNMFDRQLAEHMDVDRSRSRRRHKDRDSDSDGEGEGDERNGRKDKNMKELVALADQRLVEIARIYEVDAQALRHQYVLSSLYVSAPNNNSRKDNLHNGSTTAKGHKNGNEQNSSNSYKHKSLGGQHRGKRGKDREGKHKQGQIQANREEKDRKARLFAKEQPEETSKIDVPEGGLLGLRLEEEVERELEMERNRNADRDKQVDEQGCRAGRSFSSDSLMLESASQVGLPCRKKKKNHTGNGYSMQEIQSNKWLRDAYKSRIEMKLLVTKQQVAVTEQMQLHVQAEDRNGRAEKEGNEVETKTEMEREAEGQLHGIQTRDEDTDVVAKKLNAILLKSLAERQRN
ncbi:hypothetical protein WR25_13713 [Diploscapter pachys]|uniref:Uncharacterized protein n=1 Tax=Diploscapter pachys TaxID=2018661 RepID=A0A2A2J6B2_9BILA|nr:hypothetical protein WR25_13713 [Diploscapter pachys]